MLISVKEANINQAEIISRLATETFYETYAWYNTAENMREYTETHFNLNKTQEELKQEGTHFLLAYANDEVVGYVKLRNTDDPPELKNKKRIEIERIYVQQKFQKHKVGYALIQYAIDLARKKELDCIWLGVWEKNTRALAFYERVGFKIFGEHIFTLGNDAQRDHLMKFDLR